MLYRCKRVNMFHLSLRRRLRLSVCHANSVMCVKRFLPNFSLNKSAQLLQTDSAYIRDFSRLSKLLSVVNKIINLRLIPWERRTNKTKSVACLSHKLLVRRRITTHDGLSRPNKAIPLASLSTMIACFSIISKNLFHSARNLTMISNINCMYFIEGQSNT